MSVNLQFDKWFSLLFFLQWTSVQQYKIFYCVKVNRKCSRNLNIDIYYYKEQYNLNNMQIY